MQLSNPWKRAILSIFPTFFVKLILITKGLSSYVASLEKGQILCPDVSWNVCSWDMECPALPRRTSPYLHVGDH